MEASPPLANHLPYGPININVHVSGVTNEGEGCTVHEQGGGWGPRAAAVMPAATPSPPPITAHPHAPQLVSGGLSRHEEVCTVAQTEGERGVAGNAPDPPLHRAPPSPAGAGIQINLPPSAEPAPVTPGSPPRELVEYAMRVHAAACAEQAQQMRRSGNHGQLMVVGDAGSQPGPY